MSITKENQYQLGDWVKLKAKGSVIKLKYAWQVEQANGSYYEYIEPATDAEARIEWFRRHDRGDWELRHGDFIRDAPSMRSHEVSRTVKKSNRVEVITDRGVYDLEIIKQRFRVACFNHDRKDTNKFVSFKE